jgi:hypothetical protein
MHRTCLSAVVMIALIFSVSPAKGQSEENRTVEDGGVFVPGWMASSDSKEAKLSIKDDVLYVTTGPAMTYWNPENTVSGDYTVSATFTEPKYMNINDHPHPYGIVIAGNDMGTDQQSYLYCAAYGDGRFIVRGMGPEPFQMNGRRPEAHEAVNKAAGPGEPVTQEIAMSVMDDTVQCSINGTVVASYNKSDVIGEGKLKSTDGVYGIRFAHNTDGMVIGLTATGQ